MSDRRSFLRGLVQASAAALGAIVAPIAASALPLPLADPDADLFGLIERWQETRAAWDAAEDPLDETHGRAVAAYPPRPIALHAVWTDLHHHLAAEATLRTVDGNGRCKSFYGHDDVEKLRASPPVTRWAIADDSVDPPPREPDPEGEARRQEIVAAHDRWSAERKSVEDATGYTAAVEHVEAMADAWTAVDEALRSCRPRTVAGIVRKAAWVADCLSRDIGRDDVGEVFARQVAAFGRVPA